MNRIKSKKKKGGGIRLDILKNRSLEFQLKRSIPFTATFISKLKYFPGSTRILHFVTNKFRFNPGWIKHHTGFDWKIDSFHAQQMHLYSCEPFTSKVLSSMCLNSNFFSILAQIEVGIHAF